MATQEELRTKLVEVIARVYTLEQLDTIVLRALGNDLQYYVQIIDRLTTVDKLVSELERKPNLLEDLLLKIRVITNRPAVQAAIDGYYGQPGPPDAYMELTVPDQPFVNRQISRDKIKDLFKNPVRRALVVKGPRASGKSWSRLLLEYVARHEGIEPVFVELKKAELQDVVNQIINEMNLPASEFRDRMAQASTTAKAFIPALRGASRNMPAGQRWCLIFDSHDDNTVPEAMREFVDDLLTEIANLTMPPIYMVVLDHRPKPPDPTAPAPIRVPITDDILPLTKPDVEKFLQQLAQREGKPLSPTDFSNKAAYVLDGLNPPFDHASMGIVAQRLREKMADLGVV